MAGPEAKSPKRTSVEAVPLPIRLEPNQPRQFYRGGGSIAKFRAQEAVDELRPEDWVASTTSLFGRSPEGLSRLQDGRYLRDIVASEPEDWLGPDHVAFFGASTALLVKLLDASQRLPVHLHPPRSFAYRHLGSRHGKTEAWVVLGTQGAEPSVYLGWVRDLEPGEPQQWSADPAAMLANLNRVTVKQGDAVLVPAGTVHAIGEGVFCLELQEPTDLSIMLEVQGFGLAPGSAYLGMDRDLALSCLQRSGLSGAELDELCVASTSTTGGSSPATAPPVVPVLPPAANAYFRAERVRGPAPVNLSRSFAVLVALAGSGSLGGGAGATLWRLPVEAGSTLAVPWAAGTTTIRGDVELLRCMPPLPSDFALDDPSQPSRETN